MRTYKLHPKTNLLLGALLYLGFGFGIGLAPWILQTLAGAVSATLSLLAGLGLLYWVSRYERAKAGGASLSLKAAMPAKLGLLVLGAVVAALLTRVGGEVALRRQMALARDEGFLLPDLTNNSPVPKEQNSVTWLNQLDADKSLSKLADEKKDKKDKKDFNAKVSDYVAALGAEGPSADLSKDVQAKRARFKSHLELLDKAAACPATDWMVDHNKPQYQIEIPRYTNYLKLARLNAAEAALLAGQGKVAAAEARIAKGLWLAQAVRQEPFLVSSMVAVAIDKITLNAARVVLRKGASKWAASLDPAAPVTHVMTALKREHFGGSLQFFTHGLSKVVANDITAANKAWLYIYWPVFGWEVAEDLAYNRSLMRIYQGSVAERQALAKRQSDQQSQLGERRWMLSQNINFKGVSMFDKSLTDQANQRLALLAVKAKQSKKPGWPAKIEDLGTGEAITDPNSGQPFKLLRQGKVLKLYGVGANGVDDGGKVSEMKDGKEVGDVVWGL